MISTWRLQRRSRLWRRKGTRKPLTLLLSGSRQRCRARHHSTRMLRQLLCSVIFLSISRQSSQEGGLESPNLTLGWMEFFLLIFSVVFFSVECRLSELAIYYLVDS